MTTVTIVDVTNSPSLPQVAYAGFSISTLENPIAIAISAKAASDATYTIGLKYPDGSNVPGFIQPDSLPTAHFISDYDAPRYGIYRLSITRPSNQMREDFIDLEIAIFKYAPTGVGVNPLYAQVFPLKFIDITPPPTIVLTPQSTPSTTATADVFFITTNVQAGSTVSFTVSPAEFAVALLNSQEQSYPYTFFTPEGLTVSNIFQGLLDGFRLVITRPPGSTGAAEATVTPAINSTDYSSATVNFIDPPTLRVAPRNSPSSGNVINVDVSVANIPESPFTMRVVITNFDNGYTASFEDADGTAFSRASFDEGTLVATNVTQEDLDNYDVVIRRPADDILSSVIDIETRIVWNDNDPELLNTSSVTFEPPPSPPAIIFIPQNFPPEAATANVYFRLRNVRVGSTVSIGLNPSAFAAALLNSQDQHFRGIPSTEGGLTLSDISQGDLDDYRLVITRPSGSTGAASVNITMDISEGNSATTTVNFPAASPPDVPGGDGATPGDSSSTADLQRGSASAMGLILLTLAMVLYIAFRTAKLKKGIFVISLATALTGVTLLISDNGPS